MPPNSMASFMDDPIVSNINISLMKRKCFLLCVTQCRFYDIMMVGLLSI